MGQDKYVIPEFAFREARAHARASAGAHVIDSLFKTARCRFNVVADRERQNIYVVTNASTWRTETFRNIHTLQAAGEIFDAAEKERVI